MLQVRERREAEGREEGKAGKTRRRKKMLFAVNTD